MAVPDKDIQIAGITWIMESYERKIRSMKKAKENCAGIGKFSCTAKEAGFRLMQNYYRYRKGKKRD